MNFSRLKPADDIDVRKWLIKEFDLTVYQKERLHRDELVRFSPFQFYEDRQEEKVSPLWRLTIIFYMIYWVCLVVFLPIRWVFTGRWGYGQRFIDNFHSRWQDKLGI